MLILGISAFFHDASAALLEDGVLLSAAEEERFSRKKHDYAFPKNAIQFCLDQRGIKGGDLDYVAFFEKPFLKFDRVLRTTFSTWPRSRRLFAESMRTWLLEKLWVKSLIRKELGIDRRRILFSEHHLSHAASSYFCSPFDEAAVISYDGVGEWCTTTVGYGRGNKLDLVRELHFPHSLGLIYSVFTAFLGFEVNEGEYKVMGMAPYGEPRYVDKVSQVVRQHEDGAFQVNSKYIAYTYSTKQAYSPSFLDLFGSPRVPDVPFFTSTSGYPSYYGDRPVNYDELCRYNQYYADIAASIQSVTEELILNICRTVQQETGMTNLCIAGGVGLNSAANGRILRETPFTDLFIQPSAGDGGGSVGAAFQLWNQALGHTQRFVMEHAFWGAAYSDEDIRRALEEAGISANWARDDEELVEWTAQQIAAGNTVGWFQGRFEFGPRALGNRSILADPRRPETKDLVNAKIKFREPFRPFAPSVLEEAAGEYFELPHPTPGGYAGGYPARYMLLVVPVLPGKQDVIPAVSHMGTARLQTVQRDTNPLYYRLIERFGELTGVPVLLNTSFNVKGEVIVDTPQNAIKTFLDSGLDALVMGHALVDKSEHCVTNARDPMAESHTER